MSSPQKFNVPIFKKNLWICLSSLLYYVTCMYYKTLRFEKLQQEIIQLFSLQTSHDTFDLDLSKLQLMSYYILFPDLDAKDKEELLESQGPLEDSTHLSSASSHGRRIRWLLSSASLGNIEEEMTSVEPRLESSASGATLEVRNTCIYNL